MDIRYYTAAKLVKVGTSCRILGRSGRRRLNDTYQRLTRRQRNTLKGY